MRTATLPLALYPVANGQDWTNRVLAQYPADNAASLLAPAGKPRRKLLRKGRI